MKQAQKNDWVQITRTILTAGNRAPQVPEDTQQCNLDMWVKGYANHDASLGEPMEITTVTGRIEKGLLFAVKPGYQHTYGGFIPELNLIQKQVRTIVFGKGDEDA